MHGIFTVQPTHKNFSVGRGKVENVSPYLKKGKSNLNSHTSSSAGTISFALHQELLFLDVKLISDGGGNQPHAANPGLFPQAIGGALSYLKQN